MTIKVFKIRNKITQKFSTGGIEPRWTKRGKSWSQINHLKSHLRLFCEHPVDKSGGPHSWNWKTDFTTYVNKIPKEWEVIEIISSESGQETKIYPAKSLYPKTFKN